MATIKKSKAKNLSAGPSKMTKRVGPIDPKGKWTKVQERTIGNMKTGGVIKAQGGIMFPGGIKKTSSTTQSPISKGPYKIQKNVPSGDQLRKDWQSKEREMTTKTPNSKTVKPLKAGGSISKAQDGKKINWGTAPAPAGLDSKKSFKKKSDAAKASYTANTNPTVDYKSRKMVTPGGITGGQSVSVDTT